MNTLKIFSQKMTSKNFSLEVLHERHNMVRVSKGNLGTEYI